MRRRKKHPKLLNQLGQGMMEYVLLITIISFISVGLFKKLQGYMLSDPNSTLNQVLKFTTIDPDFKRFGIRK